jgi:formate C-acetyltransferase
VKARRTASLISTAKTRSEGREERAARLLNMKLSPSAVAGPEGTRKLMSLIRTARDLELWHLHRQPGHPAGRPQG